MSKMLADPTIRRYQCRKIFTDGHRCGSPCLRGENFCYYHLTARRPAPSGPAHDPFLHPPNETGFTLPMSAWRDGQGTEGLPVGCDG